MIKITEKLNSPVRIATFAVISIVIVSLIAFGLVSVGAKARVKKVIGLEKSYQVAIKDAGLDENQTTNVITKYGTKNGQATYEVSFESGGFRFFYNIKASDGAVIDCNMVSIEAEDGKKADSMQSDDAGGSQASVGNATDEAGQTAITGQSTGSSGSGQGAGGNGSNPNTGNSGGSGRSDSADTEAGREDGGRRNESAVPDIDAAKTIVLEKIGLDESQVINIYIKCEREDGNIKYEVEVYVQNGKYECEVDGATGKITDLEFEEDDEDDEDDDEEEDSDEGHKKDRDKSDEGDDDDSKKKSKED